MIKKSLKKKTKWEQHGNCPKCGAPIFVQADAMIADAPPQAVHTCGCRFISVTPVPATTPFIPYIQPYDPYPNSNPWQLPDTTIKMWEPIPNKTWCGGSQTVTSNNNCFVTMTILGRDYDLHPWSFTAK